MENQNNKEKSPEEKLLIKFLSYLWSDYRDTNSIQDYNTLVFGYANATHLMGFTAEKAYLLEYRRKHGAYPDKFQSKMNEWILTERL